MIEFKTSRFVVIGAGETGCSIIRYLQYKQAQIVRVLDTREIPPTINGIEVQAGKLSITKIADADIIVISPGVSIYEPVLQQALCLGKQVIGDIELFAQAISSWPTKVIGITGSNGKTTVTSLCAFVAEKCGINTLVAGNIGTPVLDAYLALVQSKSALDCPELIILELSSFQLETTFSLSMASSCVLNISEDHLDRYRDLLEYAYVKANIFNTTKFQVLNADDPLVMAMARSNLSVSYFASARANYCLASLNNTTYLQINGENYLDVADLQLVGRHNYLNVLAALALLAGAGFSLAQFKPALLKFKGLEHRMQKIIEHKGVLYIEDSKGTNVGAVVAGVSGLDMTVHLILGGDGKGQDFTPLRALVLAKCKSVAVIGQDAAQILTVLSGIKNIVHYATLEEAVHQLMSQAKSGEAVVLSPACASWDMFTNYKHRAKVFIDTVYANLN